MTVDGAAYEDGEVWIVCMWGRGSKELSFTSAGWGKLSGVLSAMS